MLGVQWPIISSVPSVVDDNCSDINYKHPAYGKDVLSEEGAQTVIHEVAIPAGIYPSEALNTPKDSQMPLQLASDHDIGHVFTATHATTDFAHEVHTGLLAVPVTDHDSEDRDSGVESGVDSSDFPTICAKMHASPAAYLSAKLCEKPFLDSRSTLADLLTASLASARASNSNNNNNNSSSATIPAVMRRWNETVFNGSTPNTTTALAAPSESTPYSMDPTINESHPAAGNIVYPGRRRRSVVLEHLELLARERMFNNSSNNNSSNSNNDMDMMSMRTGRRMSLTQDAVSFLPSTMMDLPASFNTRRRLSLPATSFHTGPEPLTPPTAPWSMLEESERLQAVPEAHISPKPLPMTNELPPAVIPAATYLESNADRSADMTSTTVASNSDHSNTSHNTQQSLSTRVTWQLPCGKSSMKNTAPRKPSKLRHCITADDLIQLAKETESEQESDSQTSTSLPSLRTLGTSRNGSNLISNSHSSKHRRRYHKARPGHMEWHPDTLPECSELEEAELDSIHWSNNNNGNSNSNSQQTTSHGMIDTSSTTEVSDRTRRNRNRRNRRRRATIPPRRRTCLRDQLRDCQDVSSVLESTDISFGLLEWQGLPPPMATKSSSMNLPVNKTEQEVLATSTPLTPPWLRHLDEQVPLTALSSPPTPSWSEGEEKSIVVAVKAEEEEHHTNYTNIVINSSNRIDDYNDNCSNISNDGSHDSQPGSDEGDWSTSTNSSVDSQESARSSNSGGSQRSRLSTFSWTSWRFNHGESVPEEMEQQQQQQQQAAPPAHYHNPRYNVHARHSHGLADLLPLSSSSQAPSVTSSTSPPPSLLSAGSNTLRKRPSLARMASSVLGMGKQLVSVFGGSRQTSSPSSPAMTTAPPPARSAISSLTLPVSAMNRHQPYRGDIVHSMGPFYPQSHHHYRHRRHHLNGIVYLLVIK
ncbi:hypothetical protein BDF19DRAFT_412266 [Syncephalis fuscata]|nr:hypothetical protein BDF19DRAFT_412266 [Syncephalis fuscata]